LQLVSVRFPCASVATSVHSTWWPTPPASRIASVSPASTSLHDFVLSIRLPLPVKRKRSKPVIATLAAPSQPSVAVAVNAMGASGGTITPGALQEISGPVVSRTVTVWTSVDALPLASTAVQVTVVSPRG
jgi:hypothetical protein